MKRYTIPGILFCFLLAGCGAGRDLSPGGREMEPRELLDDQHVLTLADLQDYQATLDEGLRAGASNSGFATAQQVAPVFPFTIHRLWLSSTGGSQAFLAVSLPDTLADAAATGMVLRYKTESSALLRRWAEAQTGVLLDLRSQDSNLHQQTFTVSSGRLQFPVILVWDDAGASRAGAYLQLLRDVPGTAAATTPELKAADLPALPGLSHGRSLLQER